MLQTCASQGPIAWASRSRAGDLLAASSRFRGKCIRFISCMIMTQQIMPWSGWAGSPERLVGYLFLLFVPRPTDGHEHHIHRCQSIC